MGLADEMGGICSFENDPPLEQEHKAPIRTQAPARLHKMPQAWKKENRSRQDWRSLTGQNHFSTTEQYLAAVQKLKEAEAATNFDAFQKENATVLEKKAAELVKKVRDYDWDNTYGASIDAKDGSLTGKRNQGQHFLGNVDLINQTELIKIAKKMPKGAHLHIHFNACLPPSFLIEHARNIDAMYIRSTIRFTDQEGLSPKNMARCRVSFMVLNKKNVAKQNLALGVPNGALGDIWDPNYIPLQWMPYKQFQNQFEGGTKGAEKWLSSKMVFSEEEAHNASQTGKG